jgi:hypothetical protein
LVGGYLDNGSAGAAWVFTRSGSTWEQQGPKLTGSGESGAGKLGDSVALSQEGTTALVGGYVDNGGAGAAWVFTRSGSTWEQQKLTGSGESGPGEFGYGVALSGAGNTALIGGVSDNGGIGAAWVFTRSGSTWEQQKLTGSGESGKGEFGHWVALSGDGGLSDNGGVGAAWAFTDDLDVVTEPASSVTQTSATLNATVNPDGEAVSECKLEYGLTSAPYEKSAPCMPSPGSGTSPVAVAAAVSDLAINTIYHFRISATGAGGTSTGSDRTFSTLPNPPTVETKAASSITQTAATLNATVNPHGGEVTECKLEYGLTSAPYEKSAPCMPSPGSGTSPVAVSAAVTGLAPNTTYHFRISATNSGGTSTGSDQAFTTLPKNPPTVTTAGASSILQNSATLGAIVNPNGGEVSECKLEYGLTSAPYEKSAPCTSSPGSGTSPVPVTAAVTGLVANTTYHFRISATNPGGTSTGSDKTFTTLPKNPPTVMTSPASSITQTAATLTAAVNPNGAEVSKCEFEYGTTTSYGKTASCASLPGSGTTSVFVSAAVIGLIPNTTYHFRISATNSAGVSTGLDRTFTTLPKNPPTVMTLTTASVTQTSATLNANVNPNGETVSECKLEYGLTSAPYEKSAPCTPSPGSGTSPVFVSAAVTGLVPNTTYHFRISATNAGGFSTGSDDVFTTLPSPPTVVTEPATAVTSGSATLNATVNPNGGEVSECKLEYGLTSAPYEKSAPCTPSPGSGPSPVSVSRAVTGLIPNTTYHFRVSATNAGGVSTGSDEAFTTLPGPIVVSGPASAITNSSATLNATVNPNGMTVTECKLEYGTTNLYGSSAPCTPSPGSGSSAVAVSAAVGPLSGSTAYHFRISATNSGGTSTGSDETFTTLPAPHWQKNFTKLKEGEKLATISWGTLTLEPSSGGSVVCKTASANNIENTATAAKGETELLATYECKATGGECAAKGGESRVGSSALPWPEEIKEEGENSEEFREENTGVQLNIECYKAGVLTEHTLFKSGPVGAETGTFTPKWQNGPTAARPSEVLFDTSSGHLFSETGGLKLTTKGKLKIEGYEPTPVAVITLGDKNAG